jgi:phenylacetic acid degradation operon negative regulatory protein
LPQTVLASLQPAALRRVAQDFAAARPIRCTSLIVTLFGDVVSQHGGNLWLGSLVEALGLLGIDERLVRTSTFRLVQEGWLDASRAGRRSYYRFSEHGRNEYERAARRIYARERPPWDGKWTLLLPLGIPESAREDFRQAIAWAGFAALAPNVYAHPGADAGTVTEAISDLGLGERVVLMQAETDALQSRRLLGGVLWGNWQLDQLAAAYGRFVRRWAPVRRALASGSPDPAACFVARLLAVHEYRRVLLHDTDIPGQLLPRDWPGTPARRLAAEIYHAVAPGSVDFIRAHLEGANGPLPAVAESFARRFNA